ncbi:unnamed protein product [Cylindrotheca closterium]|uniref:Potassium channel domain-containing protein n=1 Tax=Cylindrotheca closterium TaxID=2856 RepID=A0AAD2G4B7_9STRA|nr:unnamed protein product [Cylindrotheca closterium]
MSNHNQNHNNYINQSNHSNESFDNSTLDSYGSLPSHTQPPGVNTYSRHDSEFSSLGFEWSRRSEDGVDQSTRTDGGDSAITANANNVTPTNNTSNQINALNSISTYNHAYIKKMSDRNSNTTEYMEEQESKDQVVPLAEVGRTLSSKSVSGELRQRNQKLQAMKKMKSVQEIMETAKRSNTIDLETGKEGGSRSQCAIIREDYERTPQSRRRRGYRKIIKFLTKPFRPKKTVSSGHHRGRTKRQKYRDGNIISRRTVSVPQGDDTQYQIFSIDESFGKGLKGIANDRSDRNKLLGLVSPEKMVTSYLFWAFRSSFIAVLMSAALWFGVITFAFGAVIYFLAHRAPKCLFVAGKDFDGQFMDAYSLSWTTFTTVGYGAVFPGTTATAENVNHCWAVTILATVEAFVGILFASFWGAIFLSKVTRVSSSAQVTFSDPVLIRFGEGVKGHNPNEEDSSESEEEQDLLSPHDHNSTYPCPILEFRLINKLASQRKGEIIDASLNMVASVNPSQVPDMNAGGARKKKKGKKGKGRKTGGGNGGSRGSVDDFENRPSEAELRKSRQTIRKILIGADKSGGNEDKNDPKAANRREFAKLYVESQDHPFFKRVWVARHILDQESPLLINDAKELIRLNGGRWPAELNNALAVRACVKFDSILVSLSGTSNADANTVYAQKIYDFTNVVVGYRFCNILYREVDGSLGVDANLLNDVIEQTGGGGEELDQRQRFSFRQSKMDILIL